MKRVGILGGTFNPLHTGHLAIAEFTQEKMDLDKVIFVPSSKPPHKRISHLASAEDRLAMVRLGTKSNPKFDVSDFEVKKGGKSYTIDTVQHFREKFDKTKDAAADIEDVFSELLGTPCGVRCVVTSEYIVPISREEFQTLADELGGVVSEEDN